MAKPILPTPPVCGADAEALLKSLQKTASRSEMAARIERAKARLSQTTRGAVVYTLPPRGDRSER